MKRFALIIITLLIGGSISAQPVKMTFDLASGLSVTSADASTGSAGFASVPLFSFEVDGKTVDLTKAKVEETDGKIKFSLDNGIEGELAVDGSWTDGWKAALVLRNVSGDTVNIANVVPFGRDGKHTYITAEGPASLTRAKLFRPGLGSIGLVLPDNAWELGYGSFNMNDESSLCAIARRKKTESAARRRYSTDVNPGGSVEYVLYADTYAGEWQNGLKKMFREEYLHDVETFDNKLFERDDLKWIRNKYLITLQFAWDHNYYDFQKGDYQTQNFINDGRKYLGGYDIFGIWPTWPTLGIDKRNQWDLYGDLPGGLPKMRSISKLLKDNGVKFFIAFNPWDQSTRKEDPYKGMARLISATDADGAVLDTQGGSSDELQNAADSVRPGVIMYSEGMAVLKDMQGIVSGRVHDAIYLSPVLNMNKYTKPEFAIFRVCQLADGRIHREMAISFFNGYGTEMNTFAPGRPDWMEEEYKYLGRTIRILRENTTAFTAPDWKCLIPTLTDSVWVNQWPDENKTLYTAFSLKPEGFSGPLFEITDDNGFHYVDLWNHEEITPDTIDNKLYASVTIGAFNKSDKDTRMEGNVGCVAKLSKLLDIKLDGDTLRFSAVKGSKVVVSAGAPSYWGTSKEFTELTKAVKLTELFGRYEGKFVVQLYEKDQLLDERVFEIKPGTARLISKIVKTKAYDKAPEGMIEVKAGLYKFSVNNEGTFISHPDFAEAKEIKINKYYIDKYPVTNGQYKKFIDASGYVPKDTVNYLKHWISGKAPAGEENHPVVYISIEDARAYAKWAGKRLPAEYEWQYAAQGNDGREWPWGKEFDSTKCNYALDKSTPVDAYKKWKSPFGVCDMVGNVWQLTNDTYDDGSYYFAIMKGGSYYKPTSSWWYVQGGPRAVNNHQMLLLVSPSFSRNATVGFRCVADAK
jgi:formylglycine-generating enzyme required for sulfatase activity